MPTSRKLDNTYISISLVDDEEMRKLNSQHRGKNSPTDVLSFNIEEKMDDGKFYLRGKLSGNDKGIDRCSGIW